MTWAPSPCPKCCAIRPRWRYTALWLAARTRGISVGWVSIIDPRFVAKMLDVPAHWALLALLCIGYPEQSSDVPELDKRAWQARDRKSVVEGNSGAVGLELG